MNELLDTIKNLTNSVDELELMNMNLSNQINKMKLYKLITSNSVAMKCIHCSKQIQTTIFLEHLQICKNLLNTSQNNSEEILISEQSNQNNFEQFNLETSKNSSQFGNKESENNFFSGIKKPEKSKIAKSNKIDNKESILTYDIYEENSSVGNKTLYENNLEEFKRKITVLKQTPNILKSFIKNNSISEEEINEIFLNSNISSNLQKKISKIMLNFSKG